VAGAILQGIRSSGNKGNEWRQSGQPGEANAHDFMGKELGKVTPYGVYDFAANEVWVSGGIEHDTAQFFTETFRLGWRKWGRNATGKRLLIPLTAEAATAGGCGRRTNVFRNWPQRPALKSMTGPKSCGSKNSRLRTTSL
jgi:hypothetical protein